MSRFNNNNNIFNNEALGLAPSLSLLLMEENNNKSDNWSTEFKMYSSTIENVVPFSSKQLNGEQIVSPLIWVQSLISHQSFWV